MEPDGWHADAWRSAMIAATIANCRPHAKRKLKPSDFILKLAPKRRQTFAEQQSVFTKLMSGEK
jgi:hypothetical protein